VSPEGASLPSAKGALLPARLDYSAIVDRPRLRWPGGARVALWVVPNLEHYEYLPREGQMRDAWPRSPHPDVLNYSSRDYGNRVGVWRLFDLLDRHGIRGTTSFNVAAFEHYPAVLEGCLARNWDYMCHGVYNTRYHYGMSEAEERAEILDCVNSFRRLTGRQLAGWLSPALSNTLNTPDLLAEAGIKYYCDWVHDEQPAPMRVRRGRLITIPYSVDLNDAPVQLQGHEGDEFERMICDAFDVIYADSAESGRVMCVAIHPYISGQPHWIRHVDGALAHICAHEGVWKATGEEIADAWLAQQEGGHAR
jgi:peptidoglycan/xylan/chitin deacetylase (PgdA/CDA1 family)